MKHNSKTNNFLTNNKHNNPLLAYSTTKWSLLNRMCRAHANVCTKLSLAM